MALRHDLVGVLPYLKKKYLRYDAYKEQSVEDIFTPEQLREAHHLSVEELRSVVVMNEGGKGFRVEPLPLEAQLSVMYGVWTGDVDGDGRKDMVLGGNFYEAKPEVGIYDGSYGCVLRGDGRGGFSAVAAQSSGLVIRGAVRDIKAIAAAGGKQVLLIAKNNAPMEVKELKIQTALKKSK